MCVGKYTTPSAVITAISDLDRLYARSELFCIHETGLRYYRRVDEIMMMTTMMIDDARARYEIKPFKRDFSPIKCAIYVCASTGFSYDRYDGIAMVGGGWR